MNTQGGTSAGDAALEVERDKIWTDAREFNERRALIEQAKGMVMFVYGIDADEAFDALRSHSQEHNVKLQLLAEQLVKDLIELVRTTGAPPKPGLDGVMLAARSRIASVAARQLDGVSKTGVPMKEL